MRISARSARNIGAAGLSMALIVGTFLTPAGAHYGGQSNGHVFNQHVKALADARYDRLRVGGHNRNLVSTNATAAAFSNVAGSPFALGGFSFTVPAGQQRYAIVEFTAESLCTGGPALAHYCVVDVLVDGADTATPNSGGDFAFDSTETGTADPGGWESHSMRRITPALGPGTHTIDLIAYVTNGAVSFRLDDSLTSVDTYRA